MLPRCMNYLRAATLGNLNLKYCQHLHAMRLTGDKPDLYPAEISEMSSQACDNVLPPEEKKSLRIF